MRSIQVYTGGLYTGNAVRGQQFWRKTNYLKVASEYEELLKYASVCKMTWLTKLTCLNECSDTKECHELGQLHASDSLSDVISMIVGGTSLLGSNLAKAQDDINYANACR